MVSTLCCVYLTNSPHLFSRTLQKTLTFLKNKKRDINPRSGLLRQLQALNNSLQRVTKAQLGNGSEHSKRFHEWDPSAIPQQLAAVEQNDDEGLLAHTFLNAQPSKRAAEDAHAKGTVHQQRLRWLDEGSRMPGSPIQALSLERPASSDYSLPSPHSGAPTLQLPWKGQKSETLPKSRPGSAPASTGTSVLKGGSAWLVQQKQRKRASTSAAPEQEAAHGQLDSHAAPHFRRPATPASVQPKSSTSFSSNRLPGIHSPSASPIASPSTVGSNGFPGFHARNKPNPEGDASKAQKSSPVAQTSMRGEATQPNQNQQSRRAGQISSVGLQPSDSQATAASGSTLTQNKCTARQTSFLPDATSQKSVLQTSQGTTRQQPSSMPAVQAMDSSTAKRAMGQLASLGTRTATAPRRRRQDASDLRSSGSQSALLLAYGARGAAQTKQRQQQKNGMRPTSAAAMMSSARSGGLSGNTRASNTASAYAIRQAHVMGQRRRSEARSSSQTRRERSSFNRGALSASSRL